METSLSRPTFICSEQTYNLQHFFKIWSVFFLIWNFFFSIWNYLRRAVKNRETKLNESSSSGKKNGNVWINEGWCLQLTNLAGRNWSRTRVMTAAVCLPACRTAGLPHCVLKWGFTRTFPGIKMQHCTVGEGLPVNFSLTLIFFDKKVLWYV